MNFLPLAYLIDWGWLRIGPPYIYININPVIFSLGPLAIRWYGLMYVVAIVAALFAIKGYTERKGIDVDTVYRILWWCIAAGLLGGRLYFVIQQPDLVQRYLLQPQHILATWEGGMAFYGAIFLVIATLIWRARVERLNALVLIDAGVLFAAAGQIFGRIGNLINGDIIGYPSTLPWSTVYQHPNSWACLDPATCNVPVQPAAGYEMLTNIVVLAIMLYLARRVTRPGILTIVYLFSYSITQFLVFFTRANLIVPILGIPLKQAQWTSLIVFIAMLPISTWILLRSKPVPSGESAARYGIPQRASSSKELEPKMLDGTVLKVEEVSSDDDKGTEVKVVKVEPEDVEHANDGSIVEHTANGNVDAIQDKDTIIFDAPTRQASDVQSTAIDQQNTVVTGADTQVASEAQSPVIDQQNTIISDAPTQHAFDIQSGNSEKDDTVISDAPVQQAHDVQQPGVADKESGEDVKEEEDKTVENHVANGKYGVVKEIPAKDEETVTTKASDEPANDTTARVSPGELKETENH